MSPTPSVGASKATLAPAPSVTVTKTVTATPVSQPADVTYTDQLQGWGNIAAVIVALLIAVVTGLVEGGRRRADAVDDAKKRAADRRVADRRLREERDAADRRLQSQIDAQNDRHRREFLAQQIQRLGVLFAERALNNIPGAAAHHIKIQLQMVPGRYLSLMKYKYGTALDDESMAEVGLRLQQRGQELTDANVPDQWIYEEIAENIRELLQW